MSTPEVCDKETYLPGGDEIVGRWLVGCVLARFRGRPTQAVTASLLDHVVVGVGGSFPLRSWLFHDQANLHAADALLNLPEESMGGFTCGEFRLAAEYGR
jgi:hypothetical protein